MNENSIYSQIILSKSGVQIPVFKSGRTVDSRYDPYKESLKLLEQINQNTHFIILIGIGSGIFIQTIIQNRPDVFVLAVEKSDDDIEFLKNLSVIQKVLENKNLKLCHIMELEQQIINLYVPAFYGNLQIIQQRGWTTENQDCIELINKAVSKATGIVSADFSVQSHFGKLWHHNILSNIKNLCNAAIQKNINLSKNKTAVVVAAGPSLDKSIKQIIDDREKLFVIATDTAFSILISYNVIPDAVVSIDGQNISNVHFIHNNKKEFSDTLFLFDLCANSSAAKAVINSKAKVCFFTSGHPLSEFLNKHFKLELPSLFSGAGTVTICAVDFAVKAGFKNIITAGTDFSYSNGKPYAKGTYLDRLYNYKASRLECTQKQFSNLEFRTELIQKENCFTTQVLQAYRSSFEDYLSQRGFAFFKENDIYKISCDSSQTDIFLKMSYVLDSKAVLEELEKIYNSKDSNKTFNTFFELTESDISLLPLISWLRNHDNKDRSDFNYFYKQAIFHCTGMGGN